MRRWNGWGDEAETYPLSEEARRYLEERVGPGEPPADASLEEVTRGIPASRLPDHPLVTADPETRLRRARGQSLPDWIALRSGRVGTVPDGVAFPENDGHVVELLRFAREAGAAVIPYGGGTSVVGHLTPDPEGPPVLSVDLGRLWQLHRLDEESLLASFGAGVRGPDLEAQLRSRGYTLGHYPQSFEYSSLGGWVVTRSKGQQSLGYGRIEDLFAGGRLQAPAGTLHLPPFPASAAGPDLRELVLGSEGRLGLLTEAVVRVRPVPESEAFHGFFFPDFTSGLAAARELAQERLALTMVRLSTPRETETTLRLAGHQELIRLLERLLGLRGLGEGKCMLLVGAAGRPGQVRAAISEARAVVGRHGGVHVGRTFGREWEKNRFRTPYLRNALWETGYAVDTLETAAPWRAVPDLVAAVEVALQSALQPENERVHVFTHLSHVYPDGSNVYVTYVFRLAADPEQNVERWHRLKGAASRAIGARGGTISHQHGVGTDHRPYLEGEKGRLGLEALRSAAGALDPGGMMNPGKLVEP
ncbi:FAD-binding oxidoreductase [Limnochorda pilosa]|uniref:FAD-linked oxidase n=1 Tax=Limnochorda pilosa TaxID=1555112 RepID=A0A0K2SH31_LIMPI|nr:FAD-binding oxidoreductase [Limnochorda pilosa]BAS26423.1 FAD-linked oxidase [Limnochorda pilosa]